MEKVILVDEKDQEIGIMEKMDAHQQGRLHRAFSVLVFNDKVELMLQKRAAHKYHSGGLWTNTCCSHPRPGEDLLAAAERRLEEEMGFNCPLKEIFSFIYQAEFSNGLVEHEFDHVFVGFYDQEPKINPHEVDDWRWISQQKLETEMENEPELFTEWFKLGLNQYADAVWKAAQEKKSV